MTVFSSTVPEVPHYWSWGLRRSLVALLGTVAAEEQQEDCANPRQAPKNMVHYLLSRMGMAYDFDFRADL